MTNTNKTAKKKKIDLRKISDKYAYTPEEFVTKFGQTKRTLNNFIREGLPVIDDEKPILILGSELKAFLKDKYRKNKHKCDFDEFWCTCCKKIVPVVRNQVLIEQTSKVWRKTGVRQLILHGKCNICNNTVPKFSSTSHLDRINKTFKHVKQL